MAEKGRALCFEPLGPARLDACAAIAAAAPDPWSRDALARAMDDENHPCFVALAGDEPLGFACFLALGDTADLQLIAVREDARRQGAAEALLRHCLPQLAARGAARVLLELRQSNAAALGLYRKLGFEELAKRPGLYQNPAEDGILMGKDLGAMPKVPARKPIRLKDHDYSQAGCYFITICTKNKQRTLARIVGDAALGVPRTQLTGIGTLVKKRIEHINTISCNHYLEHYVIMPNHIHLLITIKPGTPKAASPTKAAIPQLINSLKALTSKEAGRSLWQRAYYDHIIRDEDDYLRICQYIDENPAKWREDAYYTEI